MEAVTGDTLERVRAVIGEIPASGPERPQGAFLTAELAQSMGCGRQAAGEMVKALLAEDRVRHVKLQIRQMNGRLMTTDGYRLVSSP